MISTPFWTGTGFMKWVLMTREAAERSVGSFVVEAAILVMDMEDVFVARIAWEGQIWASLEKMEALRSGISLTGVSIAELVFRWGKEEGVYRYGFDDKVHVREVVETCCGTQSLSRRRSFISRYPLFRHVLLQKLVCEHLIRHALRPHPERAMKSTCEFQALVNGRL